MRLKFRLGLTFWSDRWFQPDEMTDPKKTQYIAALPLTELDDIDETVIEKSFAKMEKLYSGGDAPEDVLTAIVFSRTDPNVLWMDDSFKQLHVFTDNPFKYYEEKIGGVTTPPMNLWTTHPLPELYGLYDRFKVSAFTLGREWDDRRKEWKDDFRNDWAIDQIYFNLAKCDSECQQLYDDTFNNVPANLADWKPAWRRAESRIASPSKTFTRGSIVSTEIADSFEKTLEVIDDIVEETVSMIYAVDECANGSHDCHHQANCIDTLDSFTCECKDGWFGDGKNCNGVDQCSFGTHGCPRNSQCVNGEGSSTYCVCNDGYQMERGKCVDIDECKVSKRKRRGIFDSQIGAAVTHCPGTAKCINEIGGYRCECLPMYRDLSGDGKLCAGPFCDSKAMEMLNWPDTKLTLSDGTECIG